MLAKYSYDNLLKILAYIYIFMVMVFTKLDLDFNALLFTLYLLFAIPFYKRTEYYISICIVLSSISYFFVGAYEHVLSIYTILAIISTLSVFKCRGKFKLNSYTLAFTTLLSTNIIISYNNSTHSYLYGLIRLMYLIYVFGYIFTIKKCNLNIISSFLPRISCVLVFSEFLVILSNPSFGPLTRLSIAQNVNANTFAMSCAMITCILGISLWDNNIKKMESIVFKISMLLSFILLILSGSRTALMAFMIAYFITLFIKAKRENKLTNSISKIMIVGICLLFLMYFIISVFGLDINRYNYREVIASGGTNRAAIYETLIPYIFNNNYYIYGYGPGHDTSREILLGLVYRDYAHSHNTFLEAFGELGIVGLILTVLFVMGAIKRISHYCVKNTKTYVLLGVFISILVNSMGESYFCYAVFWLVLSMLNYNIKVKEKAKV